MIRLTIKREGALLSTTEREITEAQAEAITRLLDGDHVAIEIPQLTAEECGDIAVTAAEGGIGYWSVIQTYKPSRWTPDGFDVVQGNLAVADDFVFYTIEYENPESNEPPRLTADITPELLRRGFRLAIDKARADLVQRVLGLPREDWTGEIDADGADAIVQCGVFGEIVFG